jgi:UDP-N-acetyl-D-mannosaminuronic acid dehydrogenase
MKKEDLQVITVGLGYIGLPTSVLIASKGIKVTGYDINKNVIEKLNKGFIHIVEPELQEQFTKVIKAKTFTATNEIKSGNVYLIVVPTPFTEHHEPDISYVESATKTVLPLLKPDDLFIIESTSPVGTTEKMAKYIFKNRPELKSKIFIAYCPERVLPGNIMYELVHNDRVIGGIDARSTEKAVSFYSLFIEGTLHKTNSRTAEMCKLTENSSRDVQIAFANELSLICDKAGINVWELIDLANKHPRVNILQPGAGVGGHCIAVDPYFLTADFPKESQLIAKAREINTYKAFWVAEKITNAILEFELKNNRKPIVALMGLAFKPNIDDLRESPAIYITQKVMQKFADNEIMVVEPNIKEHKIYKLTDYQEAYQKADIIAFLVKHKEFCALDFNPSKIILDFCGIFKKK